MEASWALDGACEEYVNIYAIIYIKHPVQQHSKHSINGNSFYKPSCISFQLQLFPFFSFIYKNSPMQYEL